MPVGRRSKVWTSHCFSRFVRTVSPAPLEEDVVGDDDRSSAVDFEERLDVLDEIELFVFGALVSGKALAAGSSAPTYRDPSDLVLPKCKSQPVPNHHPYLSLIHI